MRCIVMQSECQHINLSIALSGRSTSMLLVHFGTEMSDYSPHIVSIGLLPELWLACACICTVPRFELNAGESVGLSPGSKDWLLEKFFLKDYSERSAHVCLPVT